MHLYIILFLSERILNTEIRLQPEKTHPWRIQEMIMSRSFFIARNERRLPPPLNTPKHIHTNQKSSQILSAVVHKKSTYLHNLHSEEKKEKKRGIFHSCDLETGSRSEKLYEPKKAPKNLS